MSAYVVDRNHIRFLVAAALTGGTREALSWWSEAEAARRNLGDVDEHELGRILWAENVKSVNCRYGEETPAPAYHHPAAVGWLEFDPAQVLKSCDCYEYQACEHEAWPDSEARAIIDALRRKFVRQLQGYDAAEWGAPEPTSNHDPSVQLRLEQGRARINSAVATLHTGDV